VEAPSSTRPDLTGIALVLEESLPDEDLTILTDSLVAMTNIFSLRRADFPLSLHTNPYRQLITHVVMLLNRRHAAGIVNRFVKVKAHCCELLNEAADALASRSPLQLRQRTVRCSVGCTWQLTLYTFT
jgi:hypothetical protein